MNVLLMEPKYHYKYPPLGLMKISTFHKERGDDVSFFHGYKINDDKQWDRIYISFVFTYNYNKLKKTVKTAKKHSDKEHIFVGGVAATVLADKIEKELGINVTKGLLNEEEKIGIKGESKIDELTPDYEILEKVDYEYPTSDAYIAYSTRGCPNNCEFCAVSEIEPNYCEYKNLKNYVNDIKEKYGEKKNLLLLDNNVLASEKFEEIIEDIKELGFKNGPENDDLDKKVDFNQGLDMRELDEEKAELLSEIPIKPARIAFDHVEMKEEYKDTIELLADEGIKDISNYLLYNFKDKPEDLLERILLNIELNEDLDVKIYSYPMKYIPVNGEDGTDRTYVGDNWTAKQIRGIQTILNATHGVVSPNKSFILRAFCNIPKEKAKNGADPPYEKLEREYKILLWMPEKYIMYREKNEKKNAREWREQFLGLSEDDKEAFKGIIEENSINVKKLKEKGNEDIKEVLSHYELLKDRAQTKLEEFDVEL